MFGKKIITIILILTIVFGVNQNTIIASRLPIYNSEGVRWINGYKVKIINYNTYKLFWDKDSQAKKYVVKVKTKAKSKTLKYTVKKTTIKLKKLKKNRKYNIYICGLNKKGKKVASTKQELRTYLTKPVFNNSKFDKTMEIEWRVDFANVKVQLYRSDTYDGQYKEVGILKKSERSYDFFYKGYCNKAVDDSAVVNNTYYYKARTVKVIKNKNKYSKFTKPIKCDAFNSIAKIEFNKIYQTEDEALISIKSLKGNSDITFKPNDDRFTVTYSSSFDGNYEKLEDSVILKQENIMYFKIKLYDDEYDYYILDGSYQGFRESSYRTYCGVIVKSVKGQIKLEENWQVVCY